MLIEHFWCLETEKTWSQRSGVLMLGERRRRWPNIKPALGEWIVYFGRVALLSNKLLFYNVWYMVISSQSSKRYLPAQYLMLGKGWHSDGPAVPTPAHICTGIGPGFAVTCRAVFSLTTWLTKSNNAELHHFLPPSTRVIAAWVTAFSVAATTVRDQWDMPA